MPDPQHEPAAPVSRFWLAPLLVGLGSGCEALHLQSILQEPALATHFVSQGLWRLLLTTLGGTVSQDAAGLTGEIGLFPLVVLALTFFFTMWGLGGWWIARRRSISRTEALWLWGTRGWIWWLLPAVWELLHLLSFLFDSTSLQMFFRSTPEFWQACTLAGWLATGFSLASAPAESALSPTPAPPALRDNARAPRSVWVAIAIYTLGFGILNGLLYAALLLPHGDSAMYEEHLWNLLHGKGFRSYLDNGRLFFGEHIQVIHLLLIPLYLVWPSQMLLEWCQSLALGMGALPVFWLARRHTGSPHAAVLCAVAYLLYFPMQFLDIAIDFKTFRPNSFEIPLLLFAFDALERGRYRSLLVWLVLTLLCQEDAAMVIAPLGVWIAVRQNRAQAALGGVSSPRARWLGLALAVFGVLYLLFVIQVALPWFRGGDQVHFTSYFDELGKTPGEIVSNVFLHPGILLGKLLTVESAIFALALLVPLGLLPVLSPGRLAIAVPLFGVLCLNQISRMPVHHFHAPLVPVIVWAAVAGLGNVTAVWGWLRERGLQIQRRSSPDRGRPPSLPKPARNTKTLPVRETSSPPAPPQRTPSSATLFAARWGVACAAVTLMFIGLSPLSISFWDPYSAGYWKGYLPGKRAELFPRVLAEIPIDSRVASTDFIHPRFTHYLRSYDYSDYRPNVPADTDYIVIDTRHPYSQIKRPEDVKEYRDHPEQWELLPDNTEGYFIVLKRRL